MREREYWLWFNPDSGRWQLHDHELHCGDCFQVSINGQWVETRIEHGNSVNHSRGWFLVTHPSIELHDLAVRRSK